MSRIVGILSIGTALAISACNGSNATATGPGHLPAVVATIGGTKITAKELETKAEGQLSKVQAQIYEVHRTTLDSMIGDLLVKEAAKKAGVSEEEFLKQEIDRHVSAPSAEEVKAFYTQRKAQIGDRKIEDVQEQIVAYLQNSQRAQLEQQLATRLKDEAKIKVYIEPPRTKVATGDSPRRGPDGALVKIIEFSDYQCPFCQRARATVKQIIDTYGDKVQYVFRDFPLSFHDNAFKAHEAAHCAGEQGKYWEMNDLLFQSQSQLGVDDLKKYAQKLGLKAEQFNSCLDQGKFAARVRKDQSEGQSAGVSGTPAFFVNGIPLSGARPFEQFKKLIDDELAK